MDFKAYEEFERIGHNLSVITIMEGAEVAGKITARYMKSGVCHVAFAMYVTKRTGGNPVSAYEKCSGWGYAKLDTAMNRILQKYAGQLKETYSINVEKYKDNLINNWQNVFTDAGYNVMFIL